MNLRKNYEMSREELDTLLEAGKPVPYMIIGGHEPSSPQGNANRAWAALGEKMGFNSLTVQPIVGKGTRHFTAVSNRESREPEQSD